MRQILINIVGNAIKFTDRGSVEIRVKLLQSQHKLQFEVKDTGRGLTEDQRKKLFAPFAQADASTTRRYSLKRCPRPGLTHLNCR